MIQDCIPAALAEAKYEVLGDGTMYAEVPSLPGVWANADCEVSYRGELESVLDEWLLVRHISA